MVVLRKRCSENMQQIYKRKPLPKCDSNKVALQLYWNHTLTWVFSCKSWNHLWLAASVCPFYVLHQRNLTSFVSIDKIQHFATSSFQIVYIFISMTFWIRISENCWSIILLRKSDSKANFIRFLFLRIRINTEFYGNCVVSTKCSNTR